MRRSSATFVIFLLAAVMAACGDERATVGGEEPGTGYEQSCLVRFAITSEGAIAALQAEVDFSRARGNFVGAGSDVECTRLDDRVAAYATNCGEEGGCWFGVRPELNVQVQSTHDVATPLELLDCRFVGPEAPTVEEFEIEVIDASDESLAQLDPFPTVAVTRIDCVDATSTTTSTTLPDPCAEVVCPPGEACDAGTCRTVTGYEIDFVLETTAELGALQYSVFYDCSAGTFVGERGAVRCRPNPDLNAYSSFNDRVCEPASESGELVHAVTSIVGIEGPALVATCEFETMTSEPPAASDFSIDVVDASDTDLHPVDGVRVFVAAVRPIAR